MRSLKEALIRKNRVVDTKMQNAIQEESIFNFLTTNYNLEEQDIKVETENNEYIVNIFAKILSVSDKPIESLTGGLFKFGVIPNINIADCNNLKDLSGLEDSEIRGEIRIYRCNKLKNLIGLPNKFANPGIYESEITINTCQNLESFEGCPEEVSQCFVCVHCPKLKNLKYMPKFRENDDAIINLCDNISLSDLHGIDSDFRGDINISQCTSLKSLHGCPKELNYFECVGCTKLETLEGGPEIINECFDCSKCIKLTDLTGSPKIVRGAFAFDKCAGLLSVGGHPDIVTRPILPTGIPKINRQVLQNLYEKWKQNK